MTSNLARMIAKSARQFTDPAEREAYVVRVCQGIARLREDVERVLAESHDDAAAAEGPPELAPVEPELPVRAPVASAPPSEARSLGVEQPGETIDRFRLVRELGVGGFGTVWLAEQFEPVRRQVALKVIKLGMDTAQVVARFEQERQALALMDHPHVARVLDAGATAAGRPYFAMDLVQGVPLQDFCDAARMTIAERLDLFLQVCAAVQHAHMKGIIHRDLKPSNVLVATRDGQPHATVIDFGIAKATSARLTERSLVTEAYQVVGTLQYMSPEQSQASPDIDTRTDVYSLGVILYELVAGAPPFDPAVFETGDLTRILTMVAEEDPPPPSARIAAQHDAMVATTRSVDLRRLATQVRGDLDWIVMRAIEKDRARRYESAEALAADIERYRGGLPVVAAPPSTGYRLRKFVRRNRAKVAAAAVVSLTLVLGIAGTTYGMFEADRGRRRAERSEQIARDETKRALAAEEQAKQRSDQLRQVAEFQAEQLRGIDASVMGVRLRADLLEKVRAVASRSTADPAAVDERVERLTSLLAGADFTGLALDALESQYFVPGLAAIESQFDAQPLVKARLLQSLADAAFRLGLQHFAEAPQREALALRRSLLGDDDPETLESLAAMALIAARLSAFDEAERLDHELIERTRRVCGEDSREHVGALARLANLFEKQSRDDEAAALRRDAWERARRVLGADDAETRELEAGIAVSHMLAGRNEEAEPMFRDLLEFARRTYGPDAYEVASPERWLGICLSGTGRSEEGEPYQRHALELARRALGDDHPTTMGALNMVGWLHRRLRRYDEAEQELTEAYERRRRVLGDDHQDTLASLRNLGELALDRARFEEAEARSRGAVLGMRRVLGPEHFDTLWAESNLARALLGLQRADEAEPYLRKLAALGDGFDGSLGTLALRATQELFGVLRDAGRLAEAAELLEHAHARAAAAGVSSDELARRLAGELAALHESWDAREPGHGHEAQAAEWRRRAETGDADER